MQAHQAVQSALLLVESGRKSADEQIISDFSQALGGHPNIGTSVWAGAVWQSHLRRVLVCSYEMDDVFKSHVTGCRLLNRAFLISLYNHIKSLKMNCIFMAKIQTNKTF